MGSHKRNRSYVLHGTPKRVSKSLALGQRRTAVVRLMSSDSSRVLVLSEIGKIVQKEIKKLCSNNYHSIIREHSPTALEYLSWRTIILEVMHKAPTLYTIIDKCLMSSNESSRHLLCVVASVTKETLTCVWYKQWYLFSCTLVMQGSRYVCAQYFLMGIISTYHMHAGVQQITETWFVLITIIHYT